MRTGDQSATTQPSGVSRILRPKRDVSVLSNLLKQWREGDEVEQRETGEFLIKALDEDRPEGAKLFP